MPVSKATASERPEPGSLGLLVLVHGIATPTWMLRPLAYRLTQYGYQVEPWHYRSLHHKIEYHAARLRDHLEDAKNGGQTPHVVAHSMGCIVTGQAMAIGPQPAVSRMVWMAPPIDGSPIATALSPILGWAIPAVRQLTRPRPGLTTLPGLQTLPETGIIAAKLDGIVPASRTRFALATAHLTVTTSHNLLLLSRSVVKEIHSFLAKGRFAQGSDPP
ncbi:MAG: esterase/lipase family protein [Pirellula sp.]|jgi:alpha-beta hydrolase superfamily lysophospholipase